MISRRKSSLRDSGMSIFSSMARIRRSSVSSCWPVYLFRSFHPFARRFLAQLLDVVLGEPGQGLPVIELEFLQLSQVVLLRLFQPREHAPHRRHLQGVRRDVLSPDALRVVVLLVDLHLFAQL